MPFRTLIDANIPAAHELFGRHGEVTTMPGREIRREHLVGVDALIVRSVTRVDEGLLDGTSIRFVGTATAGVDHVDREALARRNIAFASAPGSNADAVADYVMATLLAVAVDRDSAIRGKTLGVVGCGEVGSRVIRRVASMGMNIVGCDPFLKGPTDWPLMPLQDLLVRSDILTLHVPLTSRAESPHPTLRMIGLEALRSMRPGSWLVNTSRGGVVREGALVEALGAEYVRAAVLDVWEDEPNPNEELIDLATIATPHIAGYAADAKVRGGLMIEAALRAWIEGGTPFETLWLAEPSALLGPGPEIRLSEIGFRDLDSDRDEIRLLDALSRRVYDVRADDGRFREAAKRSRPGWFSSLRRDYPLRREMQTARVVGEIPEGVRETVGEGLSMECQALEG